MRSPILLTTVLVALVTAIPARAHVLAGKSVNLTYYTPDLSTVYEAGGTFTAPHTFNSFEFGLFNVAVTDTNIYMTFNYTFGLTCCRPYNGWVLTVIGATPITSVKINPATNLSGFALSFDSSHIYFNAPGMQGNTSSVISLDITGGCELPTSEMFQVPPPGGTGKASLVLGGLASGWDAAPGSTGYAFVQVLAGGKFEGFQVLMEEDAPLPPPTDNCPVPGRLGVTGSKFDVDSNNMFVDEVLDPFSLIFANQNRLPLSPGSHCSNVAYQQMKIFCPAINDFVPYGPLNRIEVTIYRDHVVFSRAGAQASKRCSPSIGCP